MFCLNHNKLQTHFCEHTEVTDLQSMLFIKVNVCQTAQWLSVNELLTQFNLAQKISQENIIEYNNLQHQNE